MNIHTYATHSSMNEREIKDAAIVVIDLLRASTTIITAMMHGVQKIIPAKDVNEAVAVSRSMGRDISLLAGEQGGVKLPDFDLDNSPVQFTTGAYQGKTVVLTTSNGTEAIHKARNSGPVYIGALLNKTAVAKHLSKLGKDVIFVCAGTGGRISADDLYCAGAIINALRGFTSNLTLSDTALVCEFLYTQPAGRKLVSGCAHYLRLMELGKTEDIDLCFTEDITVILPSYIDGILTPGA